MVTSKSLRSAIGMANSSPFAILNQRPTPSATPSESRSLDLGIRLSLLCCIARRIASVVVALPCRIWPIVHPSTRSRIMHHQSPRPNRIQLDIRLSVRADHHRSEHSAAAGLVQGEGLVLSILVHPRPLLNTALLRRKLSHRQCRPRVPLRSTYGLHGDGDDNAITINTDRSVGAGQYGRDYCGLGPAMPIRSNFGVISPRENSLRKYAFSCRRQKPPPFRVAA